METYRFGPFELQPDGTLLREGRPLDLPPKQSGLLRILAGAGGRIVSKAEILDRLWPVEDVSEASLTTCVRGLRLALGDRGRHGAYLETVHGRGYRFHAAGSPALAPSRTRPARVAIVPFAFDDAEERYLAEGLAGEIAAGLHRWRKDGIEAIARDSAERSWGRGLDAEAFARDLDLDFVLSGRMADDSLVMRVAVELRGVASGQVEWKQDFAGPASDSGLLAAEIAEAVAKRVLSSRGEAFREHAIRPISVDPRAHRAVLRGAFLNQYRDESGLRRSIACFEQAIGWDPRCAAAHAALGEVYLNLGWRGYAAPVEVAPLARQALARALAIDAGSAQAHAARAFLAAFVDRDRAAADAALALCAGAESAHDRSAFMCGFAQVAAGRTDDALRVLEAGLVVDPLSPNLAIARALALWFASRSEEALDAVRALTEAEPEFPAAHALRADVATALGRTEEALRSATAADALGRGDQMTRSACAWAFGRIGRTDAARTILDLFERRRGSRYVSPTFMAVGYAGVGDKESALRWLAQAAEARCMWFALFPHDPRFAALRTDPRCAALLAAAGSAREGSR